MPEGFYFMSAVRSLWSLYVEYHVCERAYILLVSMLSKAVLQGRRL